MRKWMGFLPIDLSAALFEAGENSIRRVLFPEKERGTAWKRASGRSVRGRCLYAIIAWKGVFFEQIIAFVLPKELFKTQRQRSVFKLLFELRTKALMSF
ncbi:hypothetical protein CEXT_261901 [Caerostris extrusa]|uniref:Uncharacterized protein n=1 Tax=Caerostris extrusa TaxID=172846 RepID=A0AAV4SY04_CAEEX|nr:hypothetical protein CEXT_261901 [Caerostris extrusa]